MIPPFNMDGVLPPYIGSATSGGGNFDSPYLTNLVEIVNRFATSPKRVEIIKGFIAYRAALLANGVSDGFQWVDGSFVTNKHEPSDVDVVTFGSARELQAIPRNLFEKHHCKPTYHCDVYAVVLDGGPSDMVVKQICFWHRLFSMTKPNPPASPSVPKGMLQIRLNSPQDDAAATSILQGIAFQAGSGGRP